MKTVLKKSTVDELCARISDIRSQMVAYMQFVLIDKQSDLAATIHDIDERTAYLGLKLDRIEEDLKFLRDQAQSGNIDAGTEEKKGPIKNPNNNRSDEPENEVISEMLPGLLASLHPFISKATKTRQDQDFLAWIAFDEIWTRHDDISKAHNTTFEWIFKDEASIAGPKEGEDGNLLHKVAFAEWLRSGSSIFWISGKPGSGKSTLMRFLLQHPSTKHMLKEWAKGHQLRIASHFFWNSGTTLQKSQEGLLRTLLFDILRECTEFIPLVQKVMVESEVSYTNRGLVRDQLLKAFDVLSACGLSTKFAFIIDGLDEYQGDHEQLIDVIYKLAASPDIKLCVSSRPWTCFSEAFGADENLLVKIEAFTRNDIRKFAQDNFSQNRHFRKRMNEPGYITLIEEVVDRAEGVFLWVFLVVRSLLEGFTYADRITDLMRRLEELPPDLEKFFEHILGTISSFYRRLTAETFLIAIAASEPLPLLIYSIIDDIDERPSLALSHTIITRKHSEIEDREEEMIRRLDGRTKGLLEVKSTLRDVKHGKVSCHQHRVEFLHRTVRDFLINNDMGFMQSADENFNPYQKLIQAHLALLRTDIILDDKLAIPNSVRNMLDYTWQLERNNGPDCAKALDLAEPALETVSSGPDYVRETFLNREEFRWPLTEGRRSFLSIAVGRDLRRYIETRLKREPTLVEAWPSLLAIALDPKAAVLREPRVSVPMVRLLLDHGAKPDGDGSQFGSPWRKLINTLFSVEDRSEWPSRLGLTYEEMKEVTAALIEKQAPLSARISFGTIRSMLNLMGTQQFLTAEQVIRKRFTAADSDYLVGLSTTKMHLWERLGWYS